jgi:hypothetical protein
MSRNWIVQAVAACAIALVLLFTMSCARAPMRGAEIDVNAVGVDVGENAMETVDDYPPPAANGHGPPRNGHRPPTANGHSPPPPPPPATSMESGEVVLTSGSWTSRPRAARPALPATDTVAEGPAGDVDNRPFAGLGAFVQPPVWKVGNTYSLEFVVGQNERALSEVAENRRTTTARSIWMAPTMRVTLDPNPNFEIAPQNRDQEIQDLSPERTAAWFWNVKPLKPGKFTLVARVEALQRGPDGELIRGPDGKPRTRVYPPKTVEVQVKVGAGQGVMNAIENAKKVGEASEGLFSSWQKALIALAALITALGTVWAAVRKLQGKPIRPRRLRRKKG